PGLREISRDFQQFRDGAETVTAVAERADDVGERIDGILQALPLAARGVQKDDRAGAGMREDVRRDLLGRNLRPVQAVDVPQDDELVQPDRLADERFGQSAVRRTHQVRLDAAYPAHYLIRPDELLL